MKENQIRTTPKATTTTISKKRKAPFGNYHVGKRKVKT